METQPHRPVSDATASAPMLGSGDSPSSVNHPLFGLGSRNNLDHPSQPAPLLLRPYDKTYNTNEPLPNRPNVDFDDDDVISPTHEAPTLKADVDHKRNNSVETDIF